MKIYVAARFFDKDKLKAVYKRLKTDGHKITADWSKHLDPAPYDKNQQLCKQYALKDLKGVLDCEVFILLTNEKTGSGSSTELGAALALNNLLKKPKIYIVGKHLNNVFYLHPAVNIKKTIKEVYRELKS